LGKVILLANAPTASVLLVFAATAAEYFYHPEIERKKLLIENQK
jgi:hypothetical protein